MSISSLYGFVKKHSCNIEYQVVKTLKVLLTTLSQKLQEGN